MFEPDKIGMFVPPESHSVEYLCKTFGFERSFLLNKIGFKGCRYAEKHISVSDLALNAVADLQRKNPKFCPSEIDCLVFVTQNPDYKLPTTANIIQHELGIPSTALCFDINQGCSGFVLGLNTILSIMNLNNLQKGLLITADAYSKVINQNDKNTVPLFSDGATAILMDAQSKGKVLSWDWGSDGSGKGNLIVELGGSRMPTSSTNFKPKLFLNGREIFSFAVKNVPDSVHRCIENAKISLKEIDAVVLHQASFYVVDAIRKKLGIDEEKCPFVLQDIGNTVASTLPMALNELSKTRDWEGKTVILSGFGVGYSWGTVLVRF